MDLGLAGAAAVVTGGSKGMGLAIAETLAAEGARVAVMARGAPALDAAVDTLRAAGAPDAVGLSVDMSDAESIAAGFDSVAQRWGELNSLVHTIGPGDGYFEELTDDQFEEAGGNRSATHVDFMIGSSDLDIDGVLADGSVEPLMRNGDWAQELKPRT